MNNKEQFLREAECIISSLPSYVYFADEQDTTDSLLFGGYFIHREKLVILDRAVEAVKKDVGLPPESAIKASPPNNSTYTSLRNLLPEKRDQLRESMMAILDKIDAICFFSMVWKYDRSFSPDAYKWAFKDVLQRLAITVERQVKQTKKVWYPALDVVVDWFPNPNRCKDYFDIYHKAYCEGHDFTYLEKNKIRPLRDFHACPCLLVSSCDFSPALQLADYCVSSMGELLRWAYNRKPSPDKIRSKVEHVVRHLLEGNGKTIGYGLVLPTDGKARDKVQEALSNLKLL